MLSLVSPAGIRFYCWNSIWTINSQKLLISMLLGHFRTSSNVSITSSVVWFQVDNIDRVSVCGYLFFKCCQCQPNKLALRNISISFNVRAVLVEKKMNTYIFICVHFHSNHQFQEMLIYPSKWMNLLHNTLKVFCVYILYLIKCF